MQERCLKDAQGRGVWQALAVVTRASHACSSPRSSLVDEDTLPPRASALVRVLPGVPGPGAAVGFRTRRLRLEVMFSRRDPVIFFTSDMLGCALRGQVNKRSCAGERRVTAGASFPGRAHACGPCSAKALTWASAGPWAPLPPSLLPSPPPWGPQGPSRQPHCACRPG